MLFPFLLQDKTETLELSSPTDAMKCNVAHLQLQEVTFVGRDLFYVLKLDSGEAQKKYLK